MNVQGDTNANVEYCDPGHHENAGTNTENDLVSVLKFYRRGDYFMTGVNPTDTSRN
jgi:hypothetical protein